jgi:drug/metabolite transporter (DMT)-like permease
MGLPLLLALGSALTWGAGDFFGGLATREAKAVGTTFVSQFVGLCALIVVCLLGAGGAFVGRDLAWGTAAGLSAVVGLGLFYEAMGRGAFGPVASITSVVSASVPIVVGLMFGERPPIIVLAGVLVAVVAIFLIAGERADPSERRDNKRTWQSANACAVGAGLFFGGYFVLLSRTSSTSGLWPLVAGRGAAALALAMTMVVLGARDPKTNWGPSLPALKLAAVAGLLDASANALYFYASRTGLLSVVAVIASMYPASTILLARIRLNETVNRRRLIGMAVGLCAVGVIATAGGEASTSKPQPKANVQPATPASSDNSPTPSIPADLALTDDTTPGGNAEDGGITPPFDASVPDDSPDQPGPSTPAPPGTEQQTAPQQSNEDSFFEPPSSFAGDAKDTSPQ